MITTAATAVKTDDVDNDINNGLYYDNYITRITYDVDVKFT